MSLPGASTSQSTGTTVNPAVLNASSMAASIRGSLSVCTRPTVVAAAAATVKPGSSSCMPRTKPLMSRAIGPMVSRLGASGQTPSSETRPYVVFNPAVPQQADGIRTDPPVSLPSATSASSLATATAEPLLDPPGISAASSGLIGLPNHGLVPIGIVASSCRFDLPT